jgi:hypothetical protein
MLFAGFVMYLLVLIPGILPHSVDVVVMILSGISLLSVAVFGFGTVHVDGNLAILMITMSLLMLIVGTVLARQGHGHILLLLAVPALGLGLFGMRKLMDIREKHE